MPHKHKKKGREASQQDLAPSKTGPGQNAADRGPTPTKDARRKSKPASKTEDDTPRAFRRLLERQKHLTQGSKKRAGPDNDDTPSYANKLKKRKTDHDSTAKLETHKETPPRNATEIPRIQPYERLSDFAARVDASMPVAGLQKRGNKSMMIGGKTLKHPQTKAEKKMHRIQAEWRAMAKKRKEKEEADADERELEELEKDGYRVGDEISGNTIGKKRKKEDDPWKVLEKKRQKAKFGDVVERPPDLAKLRGTKLKAVNGIGTPKA